MCLADSVSCVAYSVFLDWAYLSLILRAMLFDFGWGDLRSLFAGWCRGEQIVSFFILDAVLLLVNVV